MMRPKNILENWALDTKTSMCARTIMCYFEKGMKKIIYAQYARHLDGKMKLGARRFHIRF
jgi:hypothetical protein